MDSQDKLIIKKLLKIAQNQQKILGKLAQAVDPNVEYLKQVANQVGANLGLAITTVEVYRNAGHSSSPGSGDGSIIVMPTSYIVNVGGVPNKVPVRQKYSDTFRTQVSAQKADQPDLAKNLSIMFD
jgi:hypothetical protein